MLFGPELIIKFLVKYCRDEWGTDGRLERDAYLCFVFEVTMHHRSQGVIRLVGPRSRPFGALLVCFKATGAYWLCGTRRCKMLHCFLSLIQLGSLIGEISAR